MQRSRNKISRFDPLQIGSNNRELRRNQRSGNRVSVIESDGTSNYTLKDPPGQGCKYIPPGDHRDEFYRLGTYGKFPNDSPVQMPDMAACGFYYTGFKDRVKCFSCGMTVENWALGDNEVDPKWHRTTCNMAHGTELQNIALSVPNYRTILREFKGLERTDSGRVTTAAKHGRYDIGSDLDRIRLHEDADDYPRLVLANVVDPEFERRLRVMNLRSEYERRKTFERFPSYPAPHLPGDMAKEGLFYLGNLDRTQCFSCSGVLRNWGPNDNVREQHGKHFAHCRMAQGLHCGNIPMTDTDRSQANKELAEKLRTLTESEEPPDPTSEEQRHLAVYLPCNDPLNPHMQSLQRRIETFNDSWPRTRIRAPIEQIAKAGFFYLGEGDRTKCFYCNGGLQNWDSNDEPWTEHAKWFPRCQYILRQKGVRFVRTMAENHPNLNRPLIRNPVSYENIPPFNFDEATSSANDSSGNVDMAHIHSMGFSQEKINRALARARANGEQLYTQELVQYLLEDHGPESPPRQQNAAHELRSLPMQGSIGPMDSENTPAKQTNESLPTRNEQGNSLMKSLQELKEITLCRQCKMNKPDIMYTPCGHLVLCESCSAGKINCIICHSRIHGKQKVYRA